MWRRIWYIVATFLVALLLSVVNRGVFILYNIELFDEYSLLELAKAFYYGLQLDCTIAGYITALPLIVSIATLWLSDKWHNHKAWQRVHCAYFAIITFLVSAIEVADIGMFGAWLSRIDAQVLIYSPTEMLSSLTLGNILGVVCYVGITTVVATWLYMRGVKRWFLRQLDDRLTTAKRSGYTTTLVIFGALLFLLVRGGITTATANLSKAHFSPDMLLNQAAVNPIFSLLDSATTSNDLEQYNYFTSAELEPLFEEALQSDEAVEIPLDGKWLNTERPNIVLVIMEGMGRTMTDAYEGDVPVAPHINALRAEAIWFDRLYASSFRTDRGTVATLSGFPSQPMMSIMKLPNKAARLTGIAASLHNEGYTTRFTYGGDANFTDTRAYLYATGFEEVVDEKVINIEGHRSKWGYADDALLNYASEQILRRIEEQEQPSFEVILTLSSHEPYEVPYERLNDARLNSFAFTDAEIGAFVERLKASEHWENMLVILLPDHGTPYPANIGGNTPLRHHIPMLWLGGAVRENFTFDLPMAQTDLAATLLAQLGIAHDDFTFSRNAASHTASHFGYWTYNNGWGIIDSEGTTIYDCTTEQVVTDENDPDSARLNRGKALLQKTFEVIKGL